MSEVKDVFMQISKEIQDKAKEEFDEITTEIEEEKQDNIDEKSNKLKIREKKSKKSTLIMIAIAFFLSVLCVVLLCASLSVKTKSAITAYHSEKSRTENVVYDAMSKKIFESGESRYHTSNKLSITINDIRSQGLLKVLDVKDVYYHTGNSDNKTTSDAWYKIVGTGEYVVNMNLAEMVTDAERAFVLVRIPEPVLNVSLDSDIATYNFESGLFESIGDGVNLANETLNKGVEEIKEKLRSNPTYFNCAKLAAKEAIIEMAREYNPNVDITVEVEFF